MKINVTENKVSIKEEQILNENEYNIHKIQFDFSSEYTDDLVKIALFSIDNHTYKKIISNNECDIPPEVLTQRGYSILGVYAYKTEQDTLVLRYSPSPTKISVYDGSYKADAENSEPITPSEIEQYQQILQNSLQQFQNQYNALVEETEGDIQAIEDELQRKVDEGYFDGEDGFSPIAKVIQKSNGATIEIEDKNGKTTADILNGEDGYTPVRGVDYWTEEDKQEVEEEATQQIEGKIEEYNENAAEKLNQYNQNSVQKTNDYNTNAEQKMSAYNTNATEKTSTYNSNATEKFNNYNSNAEQKETNYNTNASQKVEFFNTNASSKLSEYNSNAETKKSAYDENATQKTNSFNTNATNKLTEYNTNHTEKMSAYNSNNTEKLNAFNENATQKTEDFDEHTEQIQTDIEALQTENARLKATLPTTTGEGEDVTLDKTAELEFKKPPLPMGNSEQESTTGKNKLDISQVIIGQAWNTGSNSARAVVYMKCEPSTAYTISFNNISNFDGVYNFEKTSPEDTTAIVGVSQITTTKTITTNANSSYLGIQFNKSNISASDFEGLKIQVEEGSTATSYEPYTNGASPNPDYPQQITNVTGDVEVVVSNKNLGTFMSGFISLQGDYRTSSDMCFYFRVTKGQSYRYQSTGNRSIGAIFDSVPTENQTECIDGTLFNPLPKQSAFVAPASGIMVIYTNLNFSQEVMDSFQVEKGTEATSVVPHKEQVLPLTLGNIELCKIGDYQDYFYKESNKWYLHKEIGKVVFDGSENWLKSSNTNVDRFYLEDSSFNMITRSSGYSNYFIIKTVSTEKVGVIYTNINQVVVNYSNYNITSLSNFMTWLSTHNLIFYYVLSTPTDTEITDTTLISQLEAISNALSYEEQTNISSNQIALFNVEAYQSTKLVLEERDAKYESLEARVALLE